MLTKLLSLVLLVAQVQSYSVYLHSSPLFDPSQLDALEVIVTLTGACDDALDVPVLFEEGLMFEDENVQLAADCSCNKAASTYQCGCTFSTPPTTDFTITIPSSVDHGASNTAHVMLSTFPMSIDFINDQDNSNCPRFTGNPCVYHIRVSTGSDGPGFLFGPGTFSVESVEGPFTELSTSYINGGPFTEPDLILSFLVTSEPPQSFTVQATADSLISSSTGMGNILRTQTFNFEIKGPQPTAQPTAQPTPVPAQKVPLPAESADLCTGVPVNGKCTAKNPIPGDIFRELYVGIDSGGQPRDGLGCACDPDCVTRGDCCQSFFNKPECCTDAFCQADNNQHMVFNGPFLSCRANTDKCNSALTIQSPVNADYKCQCNSFCRALNNCCGGREDRNLACAV